jgi:hypothetical protein
LKKGFWTSKNFLLRWFLLSFFLFVPLWLKLGGGFWVIRAFDKKKSKVYYWGTMSKILVSFRVNLWLKGIGKSSMKKNEIC